jgi:asparagine synthase (glutamine-hydrolysing)
MTSILGFAGVDQNCNEIAITESAINRDDYPKNTTYAYDYIPGAAFGIFNRDTGLTCNSLIVDNYLMIVADAELYNRDALIERLGLSKTGIISSSVIILESFKRWGYECVKQLHGDFAFAIWNSAKKELYCGRDHIGVRPLHYSNVRGKFIFASELRTLKKHYPAGLSLNEDFFLDTLVTQISSKHLTAFETIYRLPPAHYLIFREGEINIINYWVPDFDRQICYKNPDDYGAMMKEQLQRAVMVRLQNVSVIGTELSGGLDSSLITCLAHDESSAQKIPCYALSNILPHDHPVELKDELEFIKKVVNSRKMPWLDITGTNDTMLGILRYNLDIQGSFIQQRFGMFNKELYKTASDQGINVLLSGFGGDEMISARFSTPWNDMLADHNWKIFLQLLFTKRNPLKAMVKAIRLPVNYLLWDFLVPKQTYGMFEPEMLEKRFSTFCLNQQFSEKSKLKVRHLEKYKHLSQKYLSQRQFQRFNHPHIPQRLEYCYTAAGNFNIQYRYPLLDTRVIEAYLSMPPHIRYGVDGNRNIFRMVMQGIVPEEIRLRDDKSGSTIPYMQMKLMEERNIILSFLDECSKNDTLKTIFDFSKFASWYEKLIERDEKDIQYLMPGAFYNYLMIMLYFKSLESGT